MTYRVLKRLILIAVAEVAISACGTKLDPIPPPAKACDVTDAVSYNNQIRPLFEKYCFACHTPGGAAPATVRFDTYADAVVHAQRIKTRIEEGSMPPPSANNPVSSKDACVFIAWVDQGATEN